MISERAEPLQVGDKVLKEDLPAEVRAVFTTRRGKIHYVVEYMSGILRIVRAHQLTRPENVQ